MELSAEDIAYRRLHKRLTTRFHSACARYGLLRDGDHILIGLSGGKDSLLLTELLGRRQHIYVPRFRVSAVHIRVAQRNYRSDVSYLSDFCRRFDVPFYVVDTAIQDVESAPEKDPCFLCSWYRRKALFDFAQQHDCTAIAFGHHRDDILQTLLMNLVYQGHFGTIPPSLQMDKMDLRLIRPLCLIDEADILSYATLSDYATQVRLCPYEHHSSRSQFRSIIDQLAQLNPEVRDSLWGAMENIKSSYLPSPLSPDGSS